MKSQERILPLPQNLFWFKLQEIVESGRIVRSEPQRWPLTPDEVASEVRRLHILLKAIADSPEYMLMDAMGGPRDSALGKPASKGGKSS